MKVWQQILVSLVIIGAGTAFGMQNPAVRSAMGFATDNLEAEGNTRPRLQTGVPVIVAEVGMAKNATEFVGVGTGRAQQSVTLNPDTNGKVVELAIVPGKQFQKGDVLLRLDNLDQKLAVSLATTRKEQADRALERAESLRQSGNLAISQLEEIRLAADITRLELEQAQNALEDTILRAPYDGVAGLPEVDIGAVVMTSTPIASFDDRRNILVEFQVPEVLLARISQGMPIVAKTPSQPGKSYSGRVTAVDSRIVTESRTARVRVSIDNASDELRPGASFEIDLSIGGSEYPLVPELSIQFTKGSLLVWRVNQGKAEAVPVKMVQRQQGNVLVDGDLETGDWVVIEGTQRLRGETPVTIIGQSNDNPNQSPTQ